MRRSLDRLTQINDDATAFVSRYRWNASSERKCNPLEHLPPSIRTVSRKILGNYNLGSHQFCRRFTKTMFLKNITASVVVISFSFSSFVVAQANENTKNDFATKIPSSTTQLIAFKNIADHAASLSKSKLFAAVFEDGFMANAPFGYNEALEGFRDSQQYYPNTIAIAGNDSTGKFGSQFFKLIYLAMLAIETEESGLGVADEDMDELIKDLTDACDQFKLPELTIWIDWEKKSTCTQAFLGMVSALTIALDQAGIEIKAESKSASAEVSLGRMIDDATLIEILEAYGIFSDNDKAIEGLIEKISAIHLKLTVENIDNGIRVTLGDSKKEYGFKDEILNGANQNNEIMIAHWNNQQMIREFQTFKALIKKWNDTETGKDFAKLDSQDFQRDMSTLIRNLERLSQTGKSRMWVEDNQLQMSVDMKDEINRKVFAKDPIMKFVPHDIDSFAISGLDNLGSTILNLLLHFEERVATAELKSILSDDVAREQQLLRFSEGYYDSFAEFRGVIIEKFPKTFELPSAYLVDSGGEFNLTVEMENWKNSQDIRIPKFAMIGKLRDPVKAKKVFEDAWLTMLQSFEVGFNLTSDLDVDFKDEVIGGVNVRVLDLSFIKRQFDINVKVKGDFIPHYFIVDNVLVFSTSKSLSEKMIRQTSLFKIEKENVVDAGKITGKSIAVVFDMYVDYFNFVLADSPSFRIEQLTNAVSGLATTAKTIDAISWNSVQTGNSRKTNFTMTFAK